jgi:hypothetical protein
MEKAKSFFAILGLGITIGVVAVLLLIFVIRATPKSVTVGGVEFEIPTPTVSQSNAPSNPAVAPTNAPTPVILATTIPQIQATTTGYTPSCNWEKDWQLQSNGSYLWLGSPPGTSSCQNVGQAGEILQKLRNGENLTFIVEVGDKFTGLNICRGNYTATNIIAGQMCVPNNPELWPQVSGTIVVTGSDGFYVGAGK